ncbi:hypothetical protein A4X13_0g8313 [Tilletia indica]|uniref:Uncharacterized protein n=1 Tax=Tilletia indica TaxID=43049 RepID=A0A8T8SG64_9BASI|nr:hypothetical protein A4X13_0g8313 [Tilletia indica]
MPSHIGLTPSRSLDSAYGRTLLLSPMPLAKLPTEILNHILAEVLIPATVKHPQPSPSTNVMPAETSSTAAESTAPSAPQVGPAEEQVSVGALKAAHSLSVVSKAFCSGAHQHVCHRFHAFDSPVGNTLRIINRWIPRPDDRYRDFLKYWQHHAGSVWPDVADLRMQAMLFDKVRADLAVTIALDARVPDMAMTTNPYSWSMWNFPQWIASSTLLSRRSKPFTSLTHLHLRITAQSDIMLIVENILLLNSQLVDVVIEADTPLEMEFYTQPILRLDKTTFPDRVYADITRFVVRGPGLQIAATDSTHFFRRIRQCTTVCFAVRSIAAEYYLEPGNGRSSCSGRSPTSREQKYQSPTTFNPCIQREAHRIILLVTVPPSSLSNTMKDKVNIETVQLDERFASSAPQQNFQYMRRQQESHPPPRQERYQKSPALLTPCVFLAHTTANSSGS